MITNAVTIYLYLHADGVNKLSIWVHLEDPWWEVQMCQGKTTIIISETKLQQSRP